MSGQEHNLSIILHGGKRKITDTENNEPELRRQHEEVRRPNFWMLNEKCGV